MLIVEPGRFSLMSEEDLSDGVFMLVQKARMEHALANAHREPSEKTIQGALVYIQGCSGINMSAERLRKILTLYPIERAKLADYGWGDTEVSDLLLNVLADFIAGTRWPVFRDRVAIDLFVRKLQCAARVMGFETVPPTD